MKNVWRHVIERLSQAPSGLMAPHPGGTEPPPVANVHEVTNPTREDLIQNGMRAGLTREQAIAFHGSALPPT